MEQMEQLGTVLMVWAHPDDETYLAGGMSALLTDAGHRVVCITATRGEAGGDGHVRTVELQDALELLGVSEHHWLDYPDGGCVDIDASEAASRIRALIDDVRPDTVITFGPDGFTGHPDHQTVSAWTDKSLVGYDARLLHPVSRHTVLDQGLDEEFGVFELGRPRECADDELALLFELSGAALDRKVEALVRQQSQTGALIEAVGIDRFRTWVSHEAFALPRSG